MLGYLGVRLGGPGHGWLVVVWSWSQTWLWLWVGSLCVAHCSLNVRLFTAQSVQLVAVVALGVLCEHFVMIALAVLGGQLFAAAVVAPGQLFVAPGWLIAAKVVALVMVIVWVLLGSAFPSDSESEAQDCMPTRLLILEGGDSDSVGWV